MWSIRTPKGSNQPGLLTTSLSLKELMLHPQLGASKNRGIPNKMDGENHGKPYYLVDDLGGFPPIFGKYPTSSGTTSNPALPVITLPQCLGHCRCSKKTSVKGTQIVCRSVAGHRDARKTQENFKRNKLQRIFFQGLWCFSICKWETRWAMQIYVYQCTRQNTVLKAVEGFFSSWTSPTPTDTLIRWFLETTWVTWQSASLTIVVLRTGKHAGKALCQPSGHLVYESISIIRWVLVSLEIIMFCTSCWLRFLDSKLLA